MLATARGSPMPSQLFALNDAVVDRERFGEA
jgi:hypothetical protein